MTNLQPLDLGALRGQDSRPIEGVSPNNIDRALVAEHIATATSRGRYKGPVEVEEFLHYRHCIALSHDVWCATLAGVLCFGKNPQEVLPAATVNIGHYPGTVPLSSEALHVEREIGGTIFQQLDRVERYLWANIRHGMTVGSDGLRRVELHEYPQLVIRELAVNMLAHRDYTTAQSAAQVRLFHDRLEFISPGGLLPGITPENILTAQASRNPMTLSILYEAGLVEGFGQGLDSVVATLRADGLPPPQFEDFAMSFTVMVQGRSHVGQTLEALLSTRQRKILLFLQTHGEASPQQIGTLFGSDVTERSIQRDLIELRELGLLTTHGKGRATRHRLV